MRVNVGIITNVYRLIQRAVPWHKPSPKFPYQPFSKRKKGERKIELRTFGNWLVILLVDTTTQAGQ